jgi:hypothetical protein
MIRRMELLQSKVLIKYPVLLLTKVLVELLIKYPFHLRTKDLTELLMRKTRIRQYL